MEQSVKRSVEASPRRSSNVNFPRRRCGRGLSHRSPSRWDDGRLILGAPRSVSPAEWNESKHAGVTGACRRARCWGRADDGRLSRAGRPAAAAADGLLRRAGARERRRTATATNIGTTPLNERYSFPDVRDRKNRTRLGGGPRRTPSPKHRARRITPSLSTVRPAPREKRI